MAAGTTTTLVLATFFLLCQCRHVPRLPGAAKGPRGKMPKDAEARSYITDRYTLQAGQVYDLSITSAMGNYYFVFSPPDSSSQLTVACNPDRCYSSDYFYYYYNNNYYYYACDLWVYERGNTGWKKFCSSGATMTMQAGDTALLFSYYETCASCRISSVTTSTTSTTSSQTSTTSTTATTSSQTTTTSTTATTSSQTPATSTTVAPRCDCGRRGVSSGSSGSRIVGGEDAAMGEFPWMVLFDVAGESGGSCSATVVSPQDLLTAAHCVSSREQVTMYIGEHSISTDEPGEITRTSVNFTIHEDYDEATLHNDIAIIHLDTPLNLTGTNISAICLPDADEDVDQTNATVAGWGQLQFQGQLPDTLQKVVVPIVNQIECTQIYANASLTGQSSITNKQICAGALDKDSCQGDSGGPLMKERSNRTYLIGTVSYGIGCGGSYPGVYTRTTEYLDWIKDNAWSTPCSQ